MQKTACFEFRPYWRPFRRPLRTRYGLWSVREGILVRLTDPETGCQGYGEIAPIPWLGSETLEQALRLCRQLPAKLSQADMLGIPNSLPACRFGLESAWVACWDPGWLSRDLSGLAFCGLLGKDPPQEAYPAYKGKIGVDPIAQEMGQVERWLQQLPGGSRLRLDANGGLTLAQARQWLAFCDRLNQDSPGQIEFVEQPLPPEHYPHLVQLSQEYQTPIALDESAARLEQLQQLHQAGWQGIFVVKLSLVGSAIALEKYLSRHPGLDLVFSSALETPIGAWQGLAWAGSLQRQAACPRAVGWGVGELFGEWDPVDLVGLSPDQRATLMQLVWELCGSA